MAKPTFNILSDTELYTNSLTPLRASVNVTSEYSVNYFIWDLGDGNTITGREIEYVYTEVGEYDITLTQYLPDGEPIKSDTQTVTVRNLIPNLMDWDTNSYNNINDSIVASVRNETPYIANVYNSWQQYDENSFLHLYVENSKSIPFDITDKQIHLKPNWRFLDTTGNVVETLNLRQQKIYAKNISGKIYISTAEEEGSVFVGTSSQSQFFFIDDTPSGITGEANYLPSTIILSQNLSSIYGDEKFTSEDYLQYPSLITSIFVDNIEPEGLVITSNGVFDIDFLKFENTEIPYNIRLVDSNGNFIKTNPIVGSQEYLLNIGFLDREIRTEYTPSFSGNTINAFSTDFSSLGGFFESYFIPLESTTESVILTAGTGLDYTINQVTTRYGVFSDENSNNLYRVSYVQDLQSSYLRKTSEVIGDTYDGFYSNKFSTLVDSRYNFVFLDSDDSRIEIYDKNFNLDRSIDVSQYDNLIITTDGLTSYRNHSSPAQIAADKDSNYYITLHDTADLLIYKDEVIQKIDLYPQILDGDEFTYQPAALEILENDEEIYIAYVSEDSNFIEKYSIDKSNTNYSISSLATITLGVEVPVDMVSNREGDKLYVLTTHYNSQQSYIKVYDANNNQLLNNVGVGYSAEFITIDANQNIWVASKQNELDDYSLQLHKYDGSLISWSLSTILNKPINHLGGIAGDSYGNVWVLDSMNDSLHIIDTTDVNDVNTVEINEDFVTSSNNYVAYGDWNGFRWYNKFGFGGSTTTYELTGQSEPFIIYPKDKHNLQKINEDFNMTETLKSYRTTDLMLNYDNLFDNFLGSIYGNNLDDGTYIGKNIYEKIANFVINHADIETCNIEALESFCNEVGVDFETRLNFPRDIKRLVDLFSIKFKKLWGDDYRTGFIEEQAGQRIDVSSYNVSADNQVKIIAKEKFNNKYSIITPLILNSSDYINNSDKVYPLRDYEQSWGWGLSVPEGGNLDDYYEFYQYVEINTDRLIDIIDWDNPLTDQSIKDIGNFSNYMSTNGIVSTVLGDQLRQGLGMYK